MPKGAKPDGESTARPRGLLPQIRDVMAGAGAAQERLDQVVTVIAAHMGADVCSVYVRRAGDVLELFATYGLSPSAVHRTRLRIGEGVVGMIAARARPQAIVDAQHHPYFAHRPETGEDIYNTLMGVPVLRGDRVIGVISVQSLTQRQYGEEEIEDLRTVAMVLAELVAGGELVSRDEIITADEVSLLPDRLEGIKLNNGIGIGFAVPHQPRLFVTDLVAEDDEKEHQRLHRAVADMHDALDRMLRSSALVAGSEQRDIIETYRMIAEDAGWLGRIHDAIASGLKAEAAVQKVQNDVRARMAKASDPYLRERIQDLDDLANRLMQHLTGDFGLADSKTLPEDTILVARSMGPAQLLDYDRTNIRGLVLEEGSPTAHVAIVARALDIPVVGHVRGILDRVEKGDPIIVDGENAQVYIRPGDDVVQAFTEAEQARSVRRAAFTSRKHLPAVTLDGQDVSINVNAGLLVDVQNLDNTGADGIGLYRTEIPFMVRPRFPGVETQRKVYANVLSQAAGRPVVFRTLDVGGDKVLPYWDDADEENPAMGWRAIRISLDRPAMLRQQLRALIRAADGGELRLMFPMITEVDEVVAARALLDMELTRATAAGQPVPSALKVGAMLEVPALLFQLPALLTHVDFISVGSNDLLQFLFATDRSEPGLAERYDPLSMPFITVLRTVVDECRRMDVPLSICGEMAGRPLDAMVLIALGFDNLSVAPAHVGPVKAMIRSLCIKPLRDYIDSLFLTDGRGMREKLRAFAQDHGVMI
jgi:phosphotransferase system, enzyme I, PtsP